MRAWLILHPHSKRCAAFIVCRPCLPCLFASLDLHTLFLDLLHLYRATQACCPFCNSKFLLKNQAFELCLTVCKVATLRPRVTFDSVDLLRPLLPANSKLYTTTLATREHPTCHPITPFSPVSSHLLRVQPWNEVSAEARPISVSLSVGWLRSCCLTHASSSGCLLSK